MANSESDLNENPGWEKGIRIGDLETAWDGARVVPRPKLLIRAWRPVPPIRGG